ncbi:hypothetical protein [Aurantivibrio plasticivorans]
MRRLVPALALLLIAGCSEEAAQQTPYRPHLSMMESMNILLDPAADVIWGSAGWDITEEGEKELWPTTEEGWNNLVHASAVVTEAGNLLMIPGRIDGVDGRGEDWTAYSQAIIDTGSALITASQERNKQAIFDLGGQLYRVCVACHTRYAYEDANE